MSNRTDLTTIMTELDAIDARLRALSGAVSSGTAATIIRLSRASVTSAKHYLAGALQHAVDPVLDLTCAAPTHAHPSARPPARVDVDAIMIGTAS